MSFAVKRFNVVKIILNKSMFDENVIHIILTEYWKDLKNKRKVLLDWINIDKIHWGVLSKNINAVDLIKKQIEYENTLSEKEYDNLIYFKTINWYYLSNNINAIHIIENNLDKIDWFELSGNPNAIDLLKIRIEYENLLDYDDLDDNRINWDRLSENPNAINLLKENQDKIDWYYLSKNPSIFEDEPMPL